MIEVERRMLEKQHTKQAEPNILFPPHEYRQLLQDLEFFVTALRSATDLAQVAEALSRIEPIINTLRSREPHNEESAPTHTEHNLSDIVAELEDLQRDLAKSITHESSLQSDLHELERKREDAQRMYHSATSARYEAQAMLSTTQAEESILTTAKASLMERKGYFDDELKEAAFLFGPQFLHILKEHRGTPELDLHTTKRSIERLKIRLDEHAGIGNEVVGEYETTIERDAFLAREVTDIEASIRNLEALIIDLKKVLDDKFTSGVSVINERFGEFFKTMFGGGGAFLSITAEKKRPRKKDEVLADIDDMDEPQEDLSAQADDRFMERGIDVHVSLPEKKVKELTMLSGGERSLVSIALLFAISQVNPPPFLVLDETDAALDEANSRRYGDMVERLSEYSQLIVVTHNRETMSRASVLYGVTLGSDGASKLLSIKFDEAVKVAK